MDDDYAEVMRSEFEEAVMAFCKGFDDATKEKVYSAFKEGDRAIGEPVSVTLVDYEEQVLIRSGLNILRIKWDDAVTLMAKLQALAEKVGRPPVRASYESFWPYHINWQPVAHYRGDDIKSSWSVMRGTSAGKTHSVDMPYLEELSLAEKSIAEETAKRAIWDWFRTGGMFRRQAFEKE
jgi:hypothetical protein